MYKEDNNKEFVCNECNSYLDNKELNNHNCPYCGSEEIYINNNDNSDPDDEDCAFIQTESGIAYVKCEPGISKNIKL